MTQLNTPHLFSALTNLQRDGDTAIRNAYRSMAAKRGIILICAGQLVNKGNPEQALTAKEFDASLGHARCHEEAMVGKLITDCRCSKHVNRKLKIGKLGWMKVTDPQTKDVLVQVTTSHAKEMFQMSVRW